MLNALIVDDEESGALGLEKLLEIYCWDVNVVGIAHSADEAAKKIKTLKPDVVFLDVQMPMGSGFDLLKDMKYVQFQVVFTTAYSQYAIKAFKYNAIDYLLKPIDPDELIEAVKKCMERKSRDTHDIKNIENLLNSISQSNKVMKVPLQTLNGIIFYDNDKVIRIEAIGKNTAVYIAGGQQISSSKSLKEYEEMLPENEFFRIHKTHMINISHIKKYTKGEGGEVEMSDGSVLEVSRHKKSEFLALFKS